jgi:hypothetical protein
MTEIPSWHITGDWFDNCSCAVACPCTFAQAPDNGFCESVLFWHIQRGHYGDINLDGLSFVRVGKWEGDLWAGKAKGSAGIFIDERADERQAEVLPRIFGGQVGGFPALVAALFAEGRQLRGVERARITFEIAPDRAQWGTEIAGKVKAWAKALTGPTSPPGKYPQLMNPPGSETGPGQLVTWGKSTSAPSMRSASGFSGRRIQASTSRSTGPVRDGSSRACGRGDSSCHFATGTTSL